MRDDINTSSSFVASATTTFSAAHYCAFCNEVLSIGREALTVYDPVREDRLCFCSRPCLGKYAAKQED